MQSTWHSAGDSRNSGWGVVLVLLVPDRREEPSDTGGFGGARRDHVRRMAARDPEGRAEQDRGGPGARKPGIS